MGRRGPKPQPSAVVQAKGNPGKRAVNHDEPVLQTAATTPPKELTGRARAEFKRLASELVAKGVLTVGDQTVFVTYCKLVASVESYEKLIKKVGEENAHKLGYANYYLKLLAQQRAHAAELGLSPSSRRNVKADKPQKVPGPVKDQPQQARRQRFFGASKIVGKIGEPADAPG